MKISQNVITNQQRDAYLCAWWYFQSCWISGIRETATSVANTKMRTR